MSLPTGHGKTAALPQHCEPAMPRLPSYVHGVCEVSLRGQTIGDCLRATTEQFGDREALVVRPQSFRANYGQFWDLVTAAAKGLLAFGIEKGQRVGVWSPNRFEWAVVQFATARVGAILVNINPAYQAAELQFALWHSGVTALFLAAGFRQTAYEPILSGVRHRCPGLRHAVMLDRDWDAFLAAGQAISQSRLDNREATLGFDDPINIQYTSGTTGRPKGATLTHHNLVNNAYFVGRSLRYSEADRVCIPVPFYHCFGMVLGTLACAVHGACAVVPAEAFEPRTVLETIQNQRCTSLYGVPTMFVALLEHPDFTAFDLTSLRTGIMAGAPCPVELMRQVVTRLHMPEVAIGYGMTETSPISTFTAPDDPVERRIGSVGRVQPHVEVRVSDPVSGAVQPRGTPGEFCARGYHVMRGYWDDPDATRNAIDETGWMHSGDLAVMDEAGYVHIVGRIKDMIIRAGENISPREIEELLITHPAVGDAQVVGVPSVKYGEEVMAWVKAKPGMAPTENDLVRYCTERIARFKVPRYWQLVDCYPLTVTGKVQKYRLREMAIEQLNLQDAAAIETA